MGKYSSGDIRNIAFVGHGGCGKTSLSEAVLKETGLITRIPSGLMDSAPDEKERGYSIDLAAARIVWKNRQVTMLDAPGYYDFFHNTVSALSVVETAVIVISATDGVTVNTRKAWEVAEKNHLPKMIVLTKLDADNLNFDEILERIQKHFGSSCVPFTMPNGLGKQLSTVENVLTSKNADAAQYRGKIVEAVVETDDALLNSYLEGNAVTNDVLQKQLGKALMMNKLVPILAVVPTQGLGISEFLDFVAEYLPSPIAVPPKVGKLPDKDDAVSFETSLDAPFSAQIFKVYNDPFGRVVYFRVYSGALSSASSVYDIQGSNSERVATVFYMLGKDLKPMDKAIAGDIVAVAKVENVQRGDTLVTNEKTQIVYPKAEYPTPTVSLAVQPKTRTDEQKIHLSLTKIAEEDATFVVRRDEETHELVVSGMSNLHLDIMLNRLKTRFKVDCSQSLPKIAYRETIMTKGEARHRHKKQSGGHGQFGEVALRIEPNERGKGFEFIDDTVGGSIPKQFMGSSEKGVRGTIEKGILAGFPVVDVKVSVWDGKTHEVDSSDAAFQIAASKAFQEAFMVSKPTLLEPVQSIEITISSKFLGDISGDLNSKRGRILGSDMNGDYQTVKAQIPLSEVQNYSADLKSITGGEGSFVMEFSHYDPVPSYLQDKIIARVKEAREKEEKKS